MQIECMYECNLRGFLWLRFQRCPEFISFTASGTFFHLLQIITEWIHVRLRNGSGLSRRNQDNLSFICLPDRAWRFAFLKCEATDWYSAVESGVVGGSEDMSADVPSKKFAEPLSAMIQSWWPASASGASSLVRSCVENWISLHHYTRNLSDSNLKSYSTLLCILIILFHIDLNWSEFKVCSVVTQICRWPLVAKPRSARIFV